jgi:hypothetical protein
MAGRRKIVQLTEENRELQATLAEERAAHIEQVRRLNALLEEGTSDEVLALRESLRITKQSEGDRTRARAVAVWKWLTHNKVRLPIERAGELAEILGARLGDLNHEAGLGNRYSRRASNTKGTQIAEMLNARRPVV